MEVDVRRDDLLSVTNAAVSALSKDTSLSESGPKQAAPYIQSDATLSPKQHIASRHFGSSPVLYSPLQPQWAKSIDGYQNDSVLSRRSMASDRSIEHSTFLHGNAQKVKVSAKKLREIKSPFDAHVQSSYDSMLRDSTEAKLNRECMPKESPERKSSVEQIELESSVEGTETSVSKRVAVEKHIVPKQLKSHLHQHVVDFRDTMDRDEKELDILTGTVTDSGFVTQNVQVIRDVQGEPHSQNTSTGEMPSLVEELYTGERVVTAHHREGDSQNSSCTQPEIVTVENTLSGETSHQDTSLRSDNSVHTSQTQHSQQSAQSSLQDRFSRFQPALLKQGSLRGSSLDSSMYSASSKEDVQIARFSLNDKHKLLKNKFVKRNIGGPVKKHVQPKLVQRPVTGVRQAGDDRQEPAGGGQQAVVGERQEALSTAAVAAASAVAATQPFLKLQQDLEYRMAQVLDKLVSSEREKQTPPAVDEETKRKLEELEHNLKDITQRRLDFLEEAQKQQISFQAQLISMSRVPKPEVPALHQSEFSSKTRAREKEWHSEPQPKYSRSKTPPRGSTGDMDQSVDRDVSVLSTPAPRQKPPRPLTRSPSQPRSPPAAPRTAQGGFLAQILAQTDSPKSSPLATSPGARFNRSIDRRESSPTVKRAQHLLHELTDLRDETENALQGDLFDRSVRCSEPAPLDTYLAKEENAPPSSPYPVRVKVSGDAPPLVNNYMDARDTLKELQEKRSYLEANLDAILRARQESEVYAAIDTLTQGSMAERLRIRKLVDQHISKMTSQMESEVMDELLRMEEKKKLSFLIPERDTSRTKPKSQDKFGYKSKIKAQSKVDSGLQRAKELAEMRLAALGKENIPRPLPKTKKAAGNVLDDSRYVERVYGKVGQQRSRSTLRQQPYPHFQTEKAKPRPVVKQTETIKGVPMSTAKTQTKPGAPGGRQPREPTMPMAVPLGVPRRVGCIPVQIAPAVPVAPSPIAAPLHPQIASTPIGHVVKPVDNVALVTVKDEEVQREEERRKKAPQLSTKVLPSVDVDGKRAPHLSFAAITPVDIDTESSLEEAPAKIPYPGPASAPRVADAPLSSRTPRGAGVPGSSKMISPALQKFVKEAQDEINEAIEKSLLKDSFEESCDETRTDEIEGSPIALPGHQRPPPQAYHGPQFPPEAPPMVEKKRQPIAEEELIFAQKQRDMLVNKANDWVEQELLARLISDVYSSKNAPKPRRETVPHATPLPRRARAQGHVEVVQSQEWSEASGHESLIAEALGQEGMQIFVDAGQEVDEGLVNALIKEVLEERIKSMAGQRTSRDDEGMPHTVRTLPTKGKVKPVEREVVNKAVVPAGLTPAVRKARAPSPPIQMPDTPVATPEPTPKGSPRASPPPQRVATPPETPDWTPEPSSADDVRAPVLRERRYSYDSDFEPEVVPEYGVKQEQDRRPPNRETYDVTTPANTPPSSPVDVMARTLSPSIKEDDYTPIASDVEEKATEPTPVPTREPSPEVSLQEQVPLVRAPAREFVSHAIQTTPPPAETPRTLSVTQTETEEEEEESETSSWATQTETGNEPISEGQWLLSTKSEGEVGGPHMDAAWKERLREKIVLTARSYDDTLHEAADIDRDQDLATQRSHSEGEFIAPAGFNAADDPYLGIVAQIGPGAAVAGTDKSLGEVTIHGRAALEAETNRLVYGLSVPKKKGKKERKSSAGNLVSPGEVLDPAFSIGQQEKIPSEAKPQAEQEEPEYKPTPSPRRGTPSPPPMAIRTITVQPSPVKSDEEGDGSPTSAAKPDDVVDGKLLAKSDVAANGNGRKMSTEENRRSPPMQDGGPGRHPSSGPIQSKSPMKSQVRRYRPGSSVVGGISAGGRPGGISPGGRPHSPDKRTYRSTEFRRSREEGTRASMEDGSMRSMTPDQINVDALLASQDYLQATQTDLSSTADLRQFRSIDFSRRSATFGEVSGELVDSGRGVRDEQEGGAAGLLATMSSTGDLSLQAGLTQTLEREESEKLLSYTVDSESDMKQSAKYPDSLEGTGPGGTRELADLQQYVTRQVVSVTMPSVADDDDYDDQDASTLSNV